MTMDDLARVRDRYAAERAKRLRPEGNAQYKELTGAFASFDVDPFTPPTTREPVVEETEVVILGGGFAGMLTAINLTNAGVRDIRILDRAGDFGGTWYWNRYPGCMCDVESYTYLPLLEETGYVPTERYTSAVEIFEYCRLLARQFELYPFALFQTEVEDAVWDDDAQRWTIRTDRGGHGNDRRLSHAFGPERAALRGHFDQGGTNRGDIGRAGRTSDSQEPGPANP